MSESVRPFVVLKFGGTSVATAVRWRTIRDLARQRCEEGLRPVLVCSALAKVSDLLVLLLDAALNGGHKAIVANIEGRHHALAADLGIAVPPEVSDRLGWLSRVAEGVHLLGEVPVRTRAEVLASGELMSTWLGVHALRHWGLAAGRVDARDLLTTIDDPSLPEAVRVLSGSCAVGGGVAPAVVEACAQAGDVVVTQGFIARLSGGEGTALLGRGGSDTSAALLAARLGAVRCEIWTDVPGMFTANPRVFPSARLLRTLDFNEAQELASMGAKVLHPRCIPPLRAAGIELSVHCTPRPELDGTRIHTLVESAPGLKAVSSRSKVTLITMDTLGMWQQPGFLARAFGVFADLGLSIDLVATSETSVTVTLDPGVAALDPSVLDRLLVRLNTFCKATQLGGLVAVSLVGRGIRAILHRLAPVFELFEEQKVHLMSQAANDLNLTVVVDDVHADRLLAQVHGALLAEVDGAAWLGGSWAAVMGAEAAESVAPVDTRVPWWKVRQQDLIEVAQAGSPAYVYDGEQVTLAAQRLKGLATPGAVLYAMKANPHPGLLARIVAEGLGVECVSPAEVAAGRAALDAAGSDAPLLFTPNFAAREEYVAGFEAGAFVTLDNLHPLAEWPEVFAGREVLVRIDPGGGAGHHAHVRTAGARSKFGVSQEQLPELARLCALHNVEVIGLHAHVGSGVRDPHAWERTGHVLASVISEWFESVRIVDLGGGLGVVEKPGQAPLDLDAFDASLAGVQALLPEGCALWLEPGRYLVAEAGVLLARVTQLKSKGPVRYVGVDVGMNSLIRPALYGAWHQIYSLSASSEERELVEVDVVGPICETGDVIGRARRLPSPQEGDVLLIGTAGAYGRAMSSSYNLRSPAREVVLG